MGDIRKELHGVASSLRALAGDYQDDCDEVRELEALAYDVDSILASLPESGAWYPSVDEVRDRLKNEHDWHFDEFIRASIGLYRERQPIQPAPEVPVVPDEIMEAAADVSFYCRAVEKDDAKLNVQLRKVLSFLQSLQGAGHD